MDNIVFSLVDVKCLFNCLINNDNKDISELCCQFLNNSSSELNDEIYLKFTNGDKKCNKIPIQNNDIDDNSEFEIALSTLSDNIKVKQKILKKFKLKLCLAFLRQELQCNPTKLLIEHREMNLPVVNCYLMDLVKIKKFLKIESNTIKYSDSLAAYNVHIGKIINNRLLILQLLHFECIIFQYLKTVDREMGDIAFMDAVIMQINSLLFNFYSLMIKLSYGK